MDLIEEEGVAFIEAAVQRRRIGWEGSLLP